MTFRLETQFKMSASKSFSVAILTVSDRVSSGVVQDEGGPAVAGELSRHSTAWDVVETKIVRDDVSEIQSAIKGWTDREAPINLVLTTGGTGFGVRDVTPEVNSLRWNVSFKNCRPIFAFLRFSFLGHRSAA